MTDEDIIGRLKAIAGEFNAALADARQAGLRVNVASLMDRTENPQCSSIVIREISKCLYGERPPWTMVRDARGSDKDPQS